MTMTMVIQLTWKDNDDNDNDDGYSTNLVGQAAMMFFTPATRAVPTVIAADA